ncbi:MAG TPA: hypothetical protein PLR28_03880 [Dokdonella sp.]|nr:hypothetical protein [Dokdonella sp.]
MGIFNTIRVRMAAAIAGKANPMSTSVIDRAAATLGIWTSALAGGFVPRQVNPYFYEALRESIGMIDGGINTLVTLDGIVRVRGKNERLVKLIRTGLMQKIPVNDNETGLQAFYASQGNEIYEQGFSVGEVVMDAKGRELIGLRVADSKGIGFARENGTLRTYYRPPMPKRTGRRDGTDEVETVLRSQGMQAVDAATRSQFVELPADRVVYANYQSEADNPYGTSIIRSIEFVAQILLRIHNATGQVWDRFGDPPLQLVYKTKNAKLQAKDLDARRDKLAGELKKVLTAKRNGNSADFVQAIGADDTIEINTIGGDGKPLEIEMPARQMAEQILSKFGLPSWMMGLQWSTAERMADQQSEMVLQASRTRFERRLPGLNTVVETWLRGRGETWNPEDWELYQELPSLRDVLKRAQAGFLLAQTALMNGDAVDPALSTDPQLTDDAKVVHVEHDGTVAFFAPRLRATRGPHRHRSHKTPDDADDAEDDAEPWAEDDAELPKIERRAVDGLLGLWRGLRDDTMRILRLPLPAKATAPAFTFDALTMLGELLRRVDAFIASAQDADGPLLREMFAAWVRGMENAVAGTDVPAAIAQARAAMVAAMGARASQWVPIVALRTFTDDILAGLRQGLYDGKNPREVARLLRQRFGAHDYDWERLARSEIARGHGVGKLDQYERLGVTEVDLIVAAADVCPTCLGLAAGNPYPIATAPIIVDDTHPLCRCTYAAHVPD